MNRHKPLRARTGLKRKTPLGGGKGFGSPRTARPRARRGSMAAAVALVMSGEVTVAQAARECGVDADRLGDRAAAEFRRRVMERDHYACLECGELATEVQHRVARGMGGTADPRIAFGLPNGVSLCARSHRLAEARDPGMYARGFWRWRGEDPARVPVHAFAEYGYELLWLLPNGETARTSPFEEAAA